MRITIHQPEHLPWLGLLAKVGAADVWVVLDSVAFRKNYFQNRNRVLLDGQPAWLTVPVTAPHGTVIRDVRVAGSPEWQRRYRGRLAHSLPEAARQGRLQPLFDVIERCRADDRLADLNLEIADWLLTEFKVGTPRVRSSELNVSGHKSELIRNLCLALGADEYLAGPSGRDYLDLADFTAHGIAVRFFDFHHPAYDQDGDSFVPYLSAIDAWARLSPADLPPLLTTYDLSEPASDAARAPSTAAEPARRRLVYVVPQLSPDTVEHFAHIPPLLKALSERVDVAVIVERGGFPDADTVAQVLEINGANLFARVVRTFRAVARCAADGHDTYFLRYSRLFLLVLLVTYPVYRHRIFLWMSGSADRPDPHRRRKSVRGRLEDAVTWLMLRGVTRLVTGPEAMVEMMSRRWNVSRRRMSLLYNDIDPDWSVALSTDERNQARHRLGWASDEFVVLFVHRLSFRRGTRLLVPLLDAVRGAIDRPLRLVVVGDGPDRLLLELAAAEVADLQVMGALPNGRLPELYGAADCFLMPSYEEGFPRVLLEAMAARLPIVTTRAGGSADVVGPDYPYIAPTGDVDTLARHLVAIGGMPPERRAAIGSALRRRAVDRFSPSHVASMLADLL